ncbi:MAG: hypothetical protein AAGF57_14540 [Pseudomonadota bacterium]
MVKRKINTLVRALTEYVDELLSISSIRSIQYFNFVDGQQSAVQDPMENVSKLISTQGVIGLVFPAKDQAAVQNLAYLFPGATIQNVLDSSDDVDSHMVWGHKFSGTASASRAIRSVAQTRQPLFLVEDGFFKNVCTAAVATDMDYRAGVSFTIDDSAFYFDATKPSRLEQMLNSEKELSDQEIDRARALVQRIVEQQLSKYNHQPDSCSGIEEIERGAVLVVDQTKGDFSIVRGHANSNTFAVMLEAALKENPNSKIVVKTHPDTLASSKIGGYYSNLKRDERVQIINQEVNPISLLRKFDKVYVCTSQMGFEALMLGIEVVTFGMPFYAGWGCTDDRCATLRSSQTNARRKRSRSILELFHFAYIDYSHYVDPVKQCPCDIEDVLDFLVKKRAEYRQVSAQ